MTSRRTDGLGHEVALEIPSGRLNIGDADDSEDVILEPGRWLLQFGVDDPEEARYVKLVISPLRVDGG